MSAEKDAALLARIRDSDPPPASQLMGFELIDLNSAEGWVECSFMARQAFLNPGRTVQGGFVSAMLDDVMSMAGVIVQPVPSWVPTLQMTTNFIRPVLPGRVLARGEVIRKGRTALHTQGYLRDEDGRLLAQATAACTPKPLPSDP